MKINATSLTVDGSIVERAREIIKKAAMPFSVTKLTSGLLSEVFDIIESAAAPAPLPLVEKLRASIHGTSPEDTAPSPVLLAAIDAAIERHLAKRGKKQK